MVNKGPKQLELKRISDGEIDKCIDPKYVYAFNYDLSPIAQAQLQADQQVLDNVKQAIFDEIGKLNHSIYVNYLLLDNRDLQALKKRLGVK